MADRTNAKNGTAYKILWDFFSDSEIPTLIRDTVDTRPVQSNGAMEKLTGYACAEIPDMALWLKKLCPDERVRQTMVKTLFRTDPRESFIGANEYEIVRKNGEKRYVQVSIYNILPPDGATPFQVVQAKDVTDRINAEENLKQANTDLAAFAGELELRVKRRTKALKESENRLKLALEGAKEGLWTIDFVKGKMFFTNHSAEMLGYSLDDLGETSVKWDAITHPEDWPKVEKALKDHFEGRTSHYEAEYRAKTKDGQWKWILGHGKVTQRDTQGNPQQAIGTHVDISKLKKTELSLRRSEERFKSLVENAPYGILIVTPDGSVAYSNPKFKEITGYLPEDLPNIDAWFKNAYPDDDLRKTVRDVWKAALKRPDRTHETEPREFGVRCKHGEVKILRITHVIIKGKKHFICYEDITGKANAEKALKMREQELRMKTDNLEEANIALNVLLKKREKDKEDIENNILYNVKNQVLPYIEKLENSQLTPRATTFLGILKSNLNDVVSPFSRKLSATYMQLTPREILVAKLIRDDKSTKEISGILTISESSVQFHRHNIRRKLGLVAKKMNLKSYLQSLV